MDIAVRHSEPDDYRALHRIFSGPRAIAGTLQLPFPRAEMWRERLSEPPEGLYSLVACVEGEVVGSLSLHTSSTRWRMRHVGSIGNEKYGERDSLGGAVERSNIFPTTRFFLRRHQNFTKDYRAIVADI